MRSFVLPRLASPSRTALSAKLLAATVLFAALPAHAQFGAHVHRETNATRQARIERQIKDTYTHRWEIAGGGGFLRFRSGQYLQQNSEITFWMNGTYYLNTKLGFTGEVRGAYGNAKIGNTAYNIPNPQVSEYPFLFGPTYRFRMHEKTALSVFVLGGTAIGYFDGDTKHIPTSDLGLWPSTNARPAFSTGLNIDLNIYPNLAYRITPSYTATTFGGTVQNNLGFEMGLVYRFGRQQ